jgi:Predicted nucleotide-binding protein containing TIR-like domain/Restriction endonuclease
MRAPSPIAEGIKSELDLQVRVTNHLAARGFEILGPRVEQGKRVDLVARKRQFGKDELLYIALMIHERAIGRDIVAQEIAGHRPLRGRVMIVSRSGFTLSAKELLEHTPDVYFLSGADLEQDAPSRRAFIVHGHDEAAKTSVARALEHLEIEPVILHEQVSRNRTIIEKIEMHRDVGFAVVLLTPDDIGATSAAPTLTHLRPRQNVLFELGYFMGYLGRDKVCVLKKGNLELLSDYDGVIYVPMDAPGIDWRVKMAQEIEAAGIDVDLRKLR